MKLRLFCMESNLGRSINIIILALALNSEVNQESLVRDATNATVRYIEIRD